MNTTLHFPNEAAVIQYLRNYPELKTEYYEEKGITKAVAELAAERFANSNKVEAGVKLGTALLIYDLQKGIDGFTGKPLPDLGKLGLPPMVWTQISTATEEALINCAHSITKR